MILVGELSLWIALLMCAWSVTLSFAGGVTRRPELVASGERGLYAGVGFVVLASAGLWTALLTSDFSLRYVASFTSANLRRSTRSPPSGVGRRGRSSSGASSSAATPRSPPGATGGGTAS